MLNINKYNLNNFITSRHILTLNFFQVYVYSIYYCIKYSCSFLTAIPNADDCKTDSFGLQIQLIKLYYTKLKSPLIVYT